MLGHGDCDNDGECEPGLKCLFRTNGVTQTGGDGSEVGLNLTGMPLDNWDFCYDPDWRRLVSSEETASPSSKMFSNLSPFLPPNYRVRRLSPVVSNISSTITMGGTVMMSRSNIETRTSSSDARVKTNVRKVNPSLILEDLMQLEVKHYDYTTNFLKSTQRLEHSNLGFIAQEVEKVVPNAVHTLNQKTLTSFDEETKQHVKLEVLKHFKTLNKDYIVVMSVASIQALHLKIEGLEAQLAALWNHAKTSKELRKEVKALREENEHLGERLTFLEHD